MSVQHSDSTKNIICAKEKNDSSFSIVAVACDKSVQNLLLDMGADVVVFSEDGVSIKDYIDAFKKTNKQQIIVFPNGADAFVTAEQAAKLYYDGDVHVVNSKGLAECYASLPAVDFSETDVKRVFNGITELLGNLFVVSLAHRKQENDSVSYYTYRGKQVLCETSSLSDTLLETVDVVLTEQEKEIITIFYGNRISQDVVESLVQEIYDKGYFVEVYSVAAEKLSVDLIVSFE